MWEMFGHQTKRIMYKGYVIRAVTTKCKQKRLLKSEIVCVNIT